MKNHNYILKSNLITALEIAIKAQKETERRNDFCGDSILVAGWKESLKALKDGEDLKVIS